MIGLHRLDQIIVAVLAHRADGAVDECVAGENHHLRKVRQLAQPAHELDAIDVRQTQIDEGDRQRTQRVLRQPQRVQPARRPASANSH